MNKNCPHCKKEIEITPQDAARVMGEIRSEKKTLSSRDNGKKKKRKFKKKEAEHAKDYSDFNNCSARR